VSYHATELFLGALVGLAHAAVMLGGFALIDRLAGRSFFIEPESTRA
jgi:hypothetical protein